MDMKKYLMGVIARKQDELKKMEERNKMATSVDEVRAIGETLLALRDEINDAQAQLSELDKEKEEPVDEGRSMNPLASYGQVKKIDARGADVDPYSTVEYRKAFMNYVQTGRDAFPAIEARDDEFTVSSEIGKIIPHTILNEFIKEVSERHGQIYAKVRKLSIKGGVEIPISDLSATAVWIAETAVSETKKAGTINTSISFSYHTLELRIAQSLLSSVVSLDVFEQEIVRIMVEAFAKEMDNMILSGSGTGQPLGILKDSRVTNVIEMTEAEFADWKKWRANVFAKVPLAKRGGGEFLMTPATWETYIMSMKDNNDRPLAKDATDATDGAYAGRFFGRDVTFVEPGPIADFATASAGDVVGVFWVPNDYVVNTNLQLAYKRWFDDNKNQFINKGIVITDGKIADTAGCYIIKKKTA